MKKFIIVVDKNALLDGVSKEVAKIATVNLVLDKIHVITGSTNGTFDELRKIKGVKSVEEDMDAHIS